MDETGKVSDNVRRFLEQSAKAGEGTFYADEDEQYPIPNMNHDALTPGKIGTIARASALEIQQVVDAETLIVAPVFKAPVVYIPQRGGSNLKIEKPDELGNWFFLEGRPTEKLSDGQKVTKSVYEVVGTRSYTSVLGAKKTLPVLRYFDMGSVLEFFEAKRLEKEVEARKREEERKWHTWTDRTGKYQVEAKLKEFKDGKAWLVKRDGAVVAVPPGTLSDDDQQFIQDELRRQRDERR